MAESNVQSILPHASNPYLPTNTPAIGDLMDVFHFDQDKGGDQNNND
jgi:hypothetical protein